MLYRKLIFTLPALGLALMSPGHAIAGEISIPLAQLDGKTDGNGAYNFRMPSLWGADITNTGMEIVLDNAAVATQSGSIRYSDEDTILGTTDMAPERFAYETMFSRIPRRGSTLHMNVAMSGKPCGTGAEILSSVDRQASHLIIGTDDGHGIRLPIIEALLGPDFGLHQPLRLWTAHGIASNGDLLSAALITQGWALRAPERDLSVEVNRLVPTDRPDFDLMPGIAMSTIPAGANILVGTQDDFSGLVSERILREISGPYVRVLLVPGKTFRTIILVSGRNEREVATAARAVGTPYFSWPDGTGVIFKVDNDKPSAAIQQAPAIAWGPNDKNSGPVTYTFSALGIDARTRTGNSGEIRLPLVVPEKISDEPETGHIRLALHAIYGPGFSSSSAITVTLGDDRLVGVYPLDKPSGGVINQAVVDIPIHLLRPGKDVIVLSPHLSTEGTNNCSAGSVDGLKTTIFADSTLTVPYIGGADVHRSLANWTSSGLLVPAAENKGSTWIVASRGDETISAALAIFARQAATVRHPLRDTALTFDWNAPAANKVIIGTHADVIGVLNREPLQDDATPFDSSQPKASGIAKLVSDYSGFSRLFGVDEDRRGRILDALHKLRISSDNPSRVAAIFAYSTHDTSIVGISAASPNDIKSDITALAEPDRWNRIHGDITLYDPRTDELSATTVVNPQQTANPATGLFSSLSENIRNTAKDNPAAWVLIGIAVIGAFAFAVRFLLHSGGGNNRNINREKGRNDPSR